MTKVVEIARTSEYWVSRAHKHRLAGRYDEAMALLGKTREQYGTIEALERELAQTYEELGCEDEAGAGISARGPHERRISGGCFVSTGVVCRTARGSASRGFLF